MTATPGLGSITPALPGDASAIFRLLVEAFVSSSLKFSIYQSQKAVVFIREQIDSAGTVGVPPFFVLRRGERVEGFYSATQRGKEYFLSYIAIAGDIRSGGAGRVLLDHFENSGRILGCETLGLDVFRSNSIASSWYARRGYKTYSVRYRMRFALEDLARRTSGTLEMDPILLKQAHEVEGFRGFSCFQCAFSGKIVKLGLINDSVCNLLEPSGPGVLEVAIAVAQAFAGRRCWLLATSDVPVLDANPAESVEEVHYMTRSAATIIRGEQ